MNCKKVLIILISITILFLANLVLATTPEESTNCLFTADNLGDVINETIGSSSEQTLQSIIDNEFGSGVIDVVNNQTQYQIWQFGENVDCIDIEIEYIAGFAGATNTFGYYFGNITGQCSSFILNPLFTDPPTSPGYTASINIPTSTYSYIGFYLDSTHQGGVTLYTEHGCNPTSIPQNPSGQRDYTLVYEVPPSAMQPGSLIEYVIAFEDPIDFDYNDVVVIVRITADNNPPSITLINPSDDDCLCCPFTIETLITDPGCPSSGIDTVEAFITQNGSLISSIFLINTDTNTWEGEVDCSQLSTGTYNLEVEGTDFCGNKDSSEVITIHIDKNPPISTKIYGTPFYTDGLTDWITTSTPISLSAIDIGCSGVKEIWYNYGSGWIVVQDDYVEFNIPTECHHTIEFYAIDLCDNQEPIQTQEINVDDSPPEIIIEYPDHGYYVDPASGFSYLKCNAQLILIGNDFPDCASGVKDIYWGYTYDGTWYPESPTTIFEYGKYWYVYDDNDPIDFTEECIHNLEYWAEDNIGNIGQIQSQTYYIDCTPPLIQKTHPPEYIEIDPDPIQTGFIPVGSSILIEAIDSGIDPCIAGVENLFWRYEHEGTYYPMSGESGAIDGATLGLLYGYTDPEIINYWWYIENIQATIQFTLLGKHDLYYWAKDNVCNNGPIHHQCYWVNECQDEIWIDDNFNYATPNIWITHFFNKQLGLDWLDMYGTAYVYDGTYYEDILIDDVPWCDNTGITQMGEYGCFPIDESAIIVGSEHIYVDDVTIKYLEYSPNINGSIVVHPDVSGITLRCNKFRKDCVADAIGVTSLTDAPINAELNWWGVPNGPNGGMMDDGGEADGFGVKVIGDLVDVEPWIGIHAEIAEPDDTIEVEVGVPIQFDASESWAYTYGPCCQEAELLHMQYEWDFDDGTYSHNPMTTHSYDTPGTYYVSLMVDAPGIPGLYANIMYDWDYVTIHVVHPDTPLTVSADGNNLGGYETIVDKPVQLYGDAYGGSGEYTWIWDFGDQSSDSTQQNPTHIYNEPGTYIATLTVTSGGETASDTVEIIVYDIDELFVELDDGFTIVGTEMLFSASIQGGLSPYSYYWDFGDGTTSTLANPSHIYESVGEYVVSLLITDSRGISKIDNAVIIVNEDVSIDPCEIVSVTGGFGLQTMIVSGTQPVHWIISVDGTVFIGGDSEGDFGSGLTETISLPFTFGFGSITITIYANDISKQYTAFLLGPFFLNLQEK